MKWLKRLLLVVASALAASAAVEVGLALLHPVPYRRPSQTIPDGRNLLHRRSPLPDLAYELAPHADKEWRGVPVRVNGYGMRDGEPRADADGLTRVVVLGDSVTFGWGCPPTRPTRMSWRDS